ncbi:hypothetical protein BT69DRAFT_602047 [Atractiella rhizophila]|nr:hypothetical protein BT69DRAFT_602047 [Atractiella rhizophila]
MSTAEAPVQGHKKLRKSVSGSVRKKSLDHSQLPQNGALPTSSFSMNEGWKRRLKISLGASSADSERPTSPVPPLPTSNQLRSSPSNVSLASSPSQISNEKRRRSRSSVDMIAELIHPTPPLPSNYAASNDTRSHRSSSSLSTPTPTSLGKTPAISFPDAIASNQVQRITLAQATRGANGSGGKRKKKAPIEVLEIKGAEEKEELVLAPQKEVGFRLGMTIDSQRRAFPMPPSSSASLGNSSPGAGRTSFGSLGGGVGRSMSVVNQKEIEKMRKSLGTAGTITSITSTHSWGTAFSDLTASASVGGRAISPSLSTSHISNPTPAPTMQQGSSFNNKAFAMLGAMQQQGMEGKAKDMDDPSKFFGLPRIESQRASFHPPSTSSPTSAGNTSLTLSPGSVASSLSLASVGSEEAVKKIRRKMPPAAVRESSIVFSGEAGRRKSSLPLPPSPSPTGETSLSMERSGSGGSDLISIEEREVKEKEKEASKEETPAAQVSPLSQTNSPLFSSNLTANTTPSSTPGTVPSSPANLRPAVSFSPQPVPIFSTPPNPNNATDSSATGGPEDLFSLLPRAAKRLEGQRAAAPTPGLKKSASISAIGQASGGSANLVGSYSSFPYTGAAGGGGTQGLGGIDGAPLPWKLNGSVVTSTVSAGPIGGSKKERKLGLGMGSIRSAVGRVQRRKVKELAEEEAAKTSVGSNIDCTPSVRNEKSAGRNGDRAEVERDSDELERLMMGFEKASKRLDTQRAGAPTRNVRKVPSAKDGEVMPGMEKKKIIGKRPEDMDIDDVEEGDEEDEEDGEEDDDGEIDFATALEMMDRKASQIPSSSTSNSVANSILARPPRSSSAQKQLNRRPQPQPHQMSLPIQVAIQLHPALTSRTPIQIRDLLPF